MFVFKLHLSDADVTAVNSKGWDATARTLAYMRATHCPHGEPERIAAAVLTAAALGLYKHGITCWAVSNDDVFEYDNIGCDRVEVEYHAKGLRTMSVGDIIVDREGVHVCANFGWVTLRREQADAIRNMVKVEDPALAA